MSDSYSSDRLEQHLGSDNDRRSSGEYGESRGYGGSDELTEAYNAGSNDNTIGRSGYSDTTDDAAAGESRSYGRDNDDEASGITSGLTSSNDYGTSSVSETTQDRTGSYSALDEDDSRGRDTDRPSSYNSSSVAEDSYLASGGPGSTSAYNTAPSNTSTYTQDPTDLPSYNTSDPTSTLDPTATTTSTMTSEHAPETRMGISHTTEPYRGGHETYGSGTTGGPGHGNKTAPDPEDLDTSSTRLDSAHKTESYLGGTEYGSGTTSGPGAGNKTGDFSSSNDSTMGKLMEKAGGLLKKDDLVEKGHEKREAAGYDSQE